MDHLWSIRRFCRWRYDLADGEEPSKSQVNAVSQMCRNHTLPAVKVGGQWRIDTKAIMEGVTHD